MEAISPEALHLIEESAPTFLTAVQRARKQEDSDQEAVAILLSLDAFYDDPILLYACLWYSATLGVRCTFVPIAPSGHLDAQQA